MHFMASPHSVTPRTVSPWHPSVVAFCSMFTARIGEIAALGTALCWTVTALSFESAGKKIGALPVNIIRLFMASVLFALYGWIVRGIAFPVDAGSHAWIWLTLSGLVGFVLGDLFLFQAFVDIGARTSMLIYSSVPVLTTIMGWFVLDEQLGLRGVAGMLLTVAGIVLVVVTRVGGSAEKPEGTAELPPSAGADGLEHHPGLAGAPDLAVDEESDEDETLIAEHHHASEAGAMTVRGEPDIEDHEARRRHIRGAFFAFGGALGQAGGLILGRIGAGLTLDPFAATQIRAIAGLLGFAILFTVTRRWSRVWVARHNGPALRRIAVGATFGPFLGVSLGLFAAQNTSAGIASTIMALVPVLIIVPAVLVFKEKVSTREIVGALVAVAGVALLFL